MNTVHLVPRLTGAFAVSPSAAKSETEQPIERANVSMNDPHPEEHASFSMIESIAPFFILKHFMSCPPMSRIKSTSGLKYAAAV